MKYRLAISYDGCVNCKGIKVGGVVHVIQLFCVLRGGVLEKRGAPQPFKPPEAISAFFLV
jgi:hypothetical protein